MFPSCRRTGTEQDTGSLSEVTLSMPDQDTSVSRFENLHYILSDYARFMPIVSAKIICRVKVNNADKSGMFGNIAKV
jgi:hypothetical protein